MTTRSVTGLALALAVVGLVAASLGQAAGSAGRPRHPVGSLPGFRLSVTAPQREAARASSVHLIAIPKAAVPGSAPAWTDVCSGTKVQWQGVDYVLTARHCFGEALVNVRMPDRPGAVYNYIAATNYRWAVSAGADSHEPLAEVTQISVTTYHDMALLRLSDDPAASAAWESIPAVDVDPPVRRPIPGEQVVLAGFSQANGSAQTIEVGRYLGRTRLPSTESASPYQDVVGVSPGNVHEDNCYFGDSGSTATFADGGISGPLSSAWNRGYPHGGQGANFADGRRLIGDLASLLHLDLRRFSTICLYDPRVPESGSRPDSFRLLVAGFAVPVPLVN